MPLSGRDKNSRNDVRRELVLDIADAVAQYQLALFQTLYLDQVGAGGLLKGGDRRVEVAVLLLQARQFVPQLAFFLFGHRHRWVMEAARGRCPALPNARELSRFPQCRSSMGKTSGLLGIFAELLRRGGGCTVTLVVSLGYTYLVRAH